jgi:hypothetical protein
LVDSFSPPAEHAHAVGDSGKTHAKLLLPFLWTGEEIVEVEEVTTDPGVARRTGVLAVTNQRVLVLNEMRPGVGLKTTLRTYSFRHRSLEPVTVEGAHIRLACKEQRFEGHFTEQESEAGADIAQRVAEAIAALKSL